MEKKNFLISPQNLDELFDFEHDLIRFHIFLFEFDRTKEELIQEIGDFSTRFECLMNDVRKEIKYEPTFELEI